jgi:hypothetical protein
VKLSGKTWPTIPCSGGKGDDPELDHSADVAGPVARELYRLDHASFPSIGAGTNVI